MKDEIISKGTATIALISATEIQDTITLITSATAAIVSIAYTLYKWYGKWKQSKTYIEKLELLNQLEKELKENARKKE